MAPSRRAASEARNQRHETSSQRRARRAAVSDVEAVLDAAARFLEVRSRSAVEVRRRLLSAGYGLAVVEAALARLTEQGYLDDEQFARAWVESRDRARPRGERALRLELSQKGVLREIIDVVLAERAASPAGDHATPDRAQRVEEPGHPESRGAPNPDQAQRVEEDAAGRLLERHQRSLLREPDSARRRQKAYALLARNGFDPDVCRTMASGFVTASFLRDDPGAG